MQSEYGWTDEYILDMRLCRLTQITQAIAARKDEEFYVLARTIEWHARTTAMVAASGISEEALAGASGIRFFPDDEDAPVVPLDASGSPQAVRVGGGAVFAPEGASEAPGEPRGHFAPDPEPVRVGGPRVSSESEAGAVPVADAQVVEKMFGLPSLAVIIRPELGEDGDEQA